MAFLYARASMKTNRTASDADERTGTVPLSMLPPSFRVTRVVSAARLAGNAPDIAFSLKSLLFVFGARQIVLYAGLTGQ